VKKKSILIIDDEENICSTLQGIFTDHGYEVKIGSDGVRAIELVRNFSFDLILLDVAMPGIDGIKTLKEIKLINPAALVIIISGYGTSEIINQSIKYGAYDFINKPFSLLSVLKAVSNALSWQELKEENLHLKEILKDKKTLHDTVVKEVILNHWPEIKNTQKNILIKGERGVGKRLAGYFISQRLGLGPCHYLFCSSGEEKKLELKLFGYEKGAFSEAEQKKIGQLEQNAGEILFFHRVENLSLSFQNQLLRVLKSRVFQRVGGMEKIRVESRFIFSSEVSLAERVSAGLFKKELLAEIGQIILSLPPLRERKKEIYPLAQYFLDRFCEEEKLEKMKLLPASRALLEEYHWPGNVRELKNVVERLALLSQNKLPQPQIIKQMLFAQ
jgi:DNA-binding NtrC family response regulator